MSLQSRLSTNDNEMKPRLLHRSPGICLMVEKKPETSARKPSDEGCVIVYCFRSGSLPPNDVRRITEQAREAERKKEVRNERVWDKFSLF